MAENRPSIRMIALEAKVSHVTVSLALRGHPSIPESTRFRIRELAERMGYRPDPELARLMAHMRNTNRLNATTVIAFLNLWPDRKVIEHDSYIHSLHKGARQRAEELGYKLEEFWLREPGMSARRFDRILFTRNIRGLMIPPLSKGMGHLSLNWKQYSAVAMTYSIPRPHLHRVCPNHAYNMRLALRELRRLGYKRIGFVIARTMDRRVNSDWTAAFLGYQEEMPKTNRVPRLQTNGDESRSLPRWVTQYRPDAIISAHSDFCRIVLDMGLRVPEDIGFVTMANSPQWPDHACVYENGIEVGRAALDQVATQLTHHEFGLPKNAHILLVEGRWAPGTSVMQTGLKQKIPDRFRAG